MKKATCKVNEIVTVPYYHFAPMRHGWNGWLFSTGIIRKVSRGAETGKIILTVEYVDPQKKDGSSITQKFYAERVFDDSDAPERANRILRGWTEEQFNNATGSNWILFLIKNGLISPNWEK